jgi:hypothetical protein
MFTIVLIAIAIVIAIAARLANVVGNDRSLAVPRSHTHELDPQSSRLHRVV